MASKIHLISGLPRSGSTLLCALLRQNPRFAAAVTSPLASLCSGLMQNMSSSSEFAPFFSDERRVAILRSLFGAYYAHVPADQIVFDTNRAWTGKTPLLKTLFPQARIICCVREVSWVIDSVERLVRTNALQPSRLFGYKSSGTVYSRVETLMNPETGLIGLAWSSLREAWFSENADRLIVIDYDRLVRGPKETLGRLYEALGEAPFAHDFDNIVYDEPDYDAQIGIPGLHKVRPKVEARKRETCLPPDLFAKYADTNFWLNPNLNPKNVVIL